MSLPVLKRKKQKDDQREVWSNVYARWLPTIGDKSIGKPIITSTGGGGVGKSQWLAQYAAYHVAAESQYGKPVIIDSLGTFQPYTRRQLHDSTQVERLMAEMQEIMKELLDKKKPAAYETVEPRTGDVVRYTNEKKHAVEASDWCADLTLNSDYVVREVWTNTNIEAASPNDWILLEGQGSTWMHVSRFSFIKRKDESEKS